jgi:thiol-disulfide isomerase/thioredoxin
MRISLRHKFLAGCVALLSAAGVVTAQAAAPSAEQALKLAPVQKDVDYFVPAAADLPKCSIKAEKIGKETGWVVRDPSGRILRRFVDTNGDNVVDQWSYYQDGLEVYRDIDADFNGKADQYRWFNIAGTRWGLDKDEDGRIDSWQAISAEEVTAEVVAALATGDSTRFARLLLTPEELKSLGVGAARGKDVAAKVTGALSAFNTVAKQQKALTAKSTWLNFGGTRPGLVPAGTDESTRDLVVYENVVAVAETAGKNQQVQIGTLVQVGNKWRIIDAPQLLAENQTELANSGYFYQTSSTSRPEIPEGTSNGPGAKAQKLMADLEDLDKAAANAASPEDRAKYNSRRADLLQQLATEATDEKDRTQWVRQLADMISAAVQGGSFPDGGARLKALFEDLQKKEADKDLAAYVRFRQLTAEYGLSLQSSKPDFVKIQTQWLKDLEQYVTDYPKGPDTAEAMLQLAIAQEFAGQEDDAKKWYGDIVKSFPTSASAKKAMGAKTRLDSVGKSITLRGKSTTGSTVDLAGYRGKVVLVHYWATWCEPCKADLVLLKELQAKYGKSGFSLIGISLDSNPQALAAYLKENRLPWAQIYEEGGLDSRLANELGILTLPTMILIDQDGKVLNRNAHVSDLDRELRAKLR